MKILAIISTIFLFSLSQALGEGLEKWELADSVLTIKRSCRKIPPYAFRDEKEISEVRFESPSSVGEIGDYAFLGCENLKKVVLPSSLKSLGEGCFRECTRLEEISIPAGIVRLPRYLFYWCEGLRNVSLPSGLKVIERNCFGYCRRLEEVSFPSTLKNIGSNAFSCCASLEEVRIPASVNELESYAFSDCLSLRKIYFPANSSLLGELILSGCEKMEDIYEMSVVPPKFDCNSFLFEPDEDSLYENVTLHVASGRSEAYRKSAGWNMFLKIEGKGE